MAASTYAQGVPLISAGPEFVGGSGDAKSVSNVISTVVTLLFYVAAGLAIVYLIMGGIRWITSRGDKANVEAARKQIIAAIVGLVVVAGAFLILNIVFNILGTGKNPLQGNFQLPSLKP